MRKKLSKELTGRAFNFQTLTGLSLGFLGDIN